MAAEEVKGMERMLGGRKRQKREVKETRVDRWLSLPQGRGKKRKEREKKRKGRKKGKRGKQEVRKGRNKEGKERWKE